MLSRKFVISLVFCFVAVIAVCAVLVYRPAEAQRSVNNRFEYAVINGSYFPFPADSQTVVSAAVNVCYLQASGCRNVETRSEVGIAKFAQDERLENSSALRGLAQQRAIEIAYSKTLSTLGTEGWEVISSPQLEFDLIYTNQQNIQTVKEGNKSGGQQIWLKRSRQ